MSFFDAISIAATGLTAERTRMDVTSENLANADTTQGANGQPYQEQDVVLQQVGGGGFSAALSGAMGAAAGGSSIGGSYARRRRRSRGSSTIPRPTSRSTTRVTRRPTQQGYVKMPNVNPVNEMVDMIDESRSYESDVTAMSPPKRCTKRPWIC